MRAYYDVIVNVPLEEELDEVFQVFPYLTDLTEDYMPRFAVDSGHPQISMLVVQQSEMGRSAAGRAVQSALYNYDTGLVVCLGIGGALSSDLKLGDVAYTGSIIDIYDNAKVADTENGIETFFAPTFYATPTSITQSLNFARTNPRLKPQYEEWQISAADRAVRIAGSSAADLSSTLDLIPSSLNGGVVCGAVSSSPTYNAKLRLLHRKVLAIETESGSVFASAAERGVDALTIRGISDYADTAKGDLEARYKGAVRRIAASNAASFLRMQFKNPFFEELLLAKRSGTLPFEARDESPELNFVPSAISILNSQIEKKLNELSPEYRLKPKGYALPIPRIKEVRGSGPPRNSATVPLEVSEALQDDRAILVTIPRNYPENSLAWMIAENLVTAEAGGKQLLPVVIDGEKVSPPAGRFASLQPEIDLDHTPEDLGGTFVFIVDNPLLTSKTRRQFLIDEYNRYPNAKIVILTRSELDTTIASEIRSSLASRSYSLSPISFVRIAHFLERHFAMPAKEAEVAALHLNNTFEHFNLPAHPTYILGIPRELLVSLLQANRRSELIQLAVDGFLTFLVASDKSAVPLSRTTRERFLRMLARQIRVEKIRLDESATVALVADFAKKYDFDLKPLEFLQGFIDQGILHFEDNEVRFSLPFIENYLLATELRQSPTDAVRYFSLGNDDGFDYSAFDLYAELGPADEIVDRVTEGFAQLLPQGDRPPSEQHILLTSAAAPKLLGRGRTLESVQKRLENAVEEVKGNEDSKLRKQRILDFASATSEAISRRRNDARSTKEKSDAVDRLEDLARHWSVATILIGAGAEHIVGDKKKTIVSHIVHASEQILEIWAGLNVSIDFDELRKMSFEDDIYPELGIEGDHDIADVKRFFYDIVDVMEYYFMCQPVLTVLGRLAGQGRSKVLETSVAGASIDGDVANLIRAVWLSDIDPAVGRPPLSKALSRIGMAPLLRLSMVTHFISQVYWKESNTPTRLALLDLADEAIRPLKNYRFDKQKLQRQIREGLPERPEADIIATGGLTSDGTR